MTDPLTEEMTPEDLHDARRYRALSRHCLGIEEPGAASRWICVDRDFPQLLLHGAGNRRLDALADELVDRLNRRRKDQEVC